MKTWTSRTIYVDIETGEIITKEEAKKNYNVVKTTKVSKLNPNKTHGTTEFTRQCRKKQQGKLWE